MSGDHASPPTPTTSTGFFPEKDAGTFGGAPSRSIPAGYPQIVIWGTKYPALSGRTGGGRFGACSIPAAQHLVAGLAHAEGVLLVEVEDGLVPICRMRAVTVDATRRVGIHRLPARQEKMPVPVLGYTVSGEILILRHIAALGDLQVAFQAVPVADRLGKRRGLDGGVSEPLEGIFRPQQFRLHPAQDTLPGVTVDAARALRGMPGCQVNRLGGNRILQVGAFRLGMAGPAEAVMGLFGGGEGKSACRY